MKQQVIFDEFIPIERPLSDLEYIDYLYEPSRDRNCRYAYPAIHQHEDLLRPDRIPDVGACGPNGAMENATNNCGEMVKYLTLVYNKRRQESITNEMMDIVGGAEALRGN